MGEEGRRGKSGIFLHQLRLVLFVSEVLKWSITHRAQMLGILYDQWKVQDSVQLLVLWTIIPLQNRYVNKLKYQLLNSGGIVNHLSKHCVNNRTEVTVPQVLFIWSCLQLKQIRSLILAGAMDHEDFLTHLRNLEPVLVLASKDLRSQIVREASVTLA